MFKTEILGKQFAIDFDEKSISVNDKKMIVEDCTEYTYKLLKRKIYARGGAPGLYNFLERNIKNDSMGCLTDEIILWVSGGLSALEWRIKTIDDICAICSDGYTRDEAIKLLNNGTTVYTPDEFIKAALLSGFYKPEFDFDFINGLTIEEFKQEVTAGTFQADGVHSVEFDGQIYIIDYCMQ